MPLDIPNCGARQLLSCNMHACCTAMYRQDNLAMHKGHQQHCAAHTLQGQGCCTLSQTTTYSAATAATF